MSRRAFKYRPKQPVMTPDGKRKIYMAVWDKKTQQAMYATYHYDGGLIIDGFYPEEVLDAIWTS